MREGVLVIKRCIRKPKRDKMMIANLTRSPSQASVQSDVSATSVSSESGESSSANIKSY